MTDNPLLERIQREAGIPNLLDVLVERLTPTDLQSLLLEVYRRRAAGIQPGQLLERYEHDRFARPSDLAPHVLAQFDSLAWSLLPEQYTALASTSTPVTLKESNLNSSMAASQPGPGN